MELTATLMESTAVGNKVDSSNEDLEIMWQKDN